MIFGVATPPQVFADVQTPNEQKQNLADANEFMSQLMSFILNNYMGGDVTLDSLVEASVKGMFGALDQYSEYLSAEDYGKFTDSLSDNYVGIGIVTATNADGRAYIKKIFENSPAEKAGLKVDDIILKIDDKEINSTVAGDITSFVRGEQGTSVKIAVKRQNDTKEFTVNREKIKISSVDVSRIDEVLKKTKGVINADMRYISIASIDDRVAEDLQKELDKAKAEGVTKLIVDLRGDGGGYVDEALAICKMLVPKGPIIKVKYKDGKIETPVSDLEKSPFKMVVLVDGNTASSSEIISSALQDSGAAKIVGEKTFGKGIMQSIIPLSDDSAIKLTTSEYFSRNGNKINKVGIMPDYVVDLPYFMYSDTDFTETSESDDIKNLKQMLNLVGYKTGDINNKYDDVTKKAMNKFQTDNKLKVTDLPDEDTVMMLDTMLYKFFSENDLVLQKGYEVLKNMK